MSDRLVLDVAKVVDELIKSGAPITPATLGKLAEQVSKSFNVKADEVALLALVQQDKFLKFVIPEKLQQVGNLPMTSTNSLAVRTAREKKPEIINNFTTARHPTVFEAVPLGQERGDPIQKIMSAPLVAENKVVGVIQVSRKGKTLGAAGPDFSPKELSDLVAVGTVLGKCVKLAAIP
jgi:GAF domain-containing protein